uniref:Glycosyl transferase family 2 n=1 Tax=uncultured marine virus TaxID=186617 RepID=A0A0F7L9E2_9VIRU|nr:Glycosyl transferase family 2 [uncultured marine virus]
MTITVNIMSYRYGHLVAQAVDSVLSQTVKPAAIRVYDDGVGDCSFIKDIYPEVELIERPKNLGTTKNFQDALERTETDYVMFLGADNYLRQDALEILTKGLNEDIVGYDVALTGELSDKFRQLVGAYERREGYPIWKFNIPDNQKDKIKRINEINFIHGSALYRVAKAKESGYIQLGDSSNPQEDWGLFKEMLKNGAIHKHIEEPLLYYRRHKENFIKNF